MARDCHGGLEHQWTEWERQEKYRPTGPHGPSESEVRICRVCPKIEERSRQQERSKHG